MSLRPQDLPTDSESDGEGKSEGKSEEPAAEKETTPQEDLVDTVARDLTTPAFCSLLDEWVDAKCPSLEDIGEGGEHSLTNTALHEEFKSLYEKQIEGNFAP